MTSTLARCCEIIMISNHNVHKMYCRLKKLPLNVMYKKEVISYIYIYNYT